MAPSNIEDVYELSPLQKVFLYHTLKSPEIAAYHNQYTLTLNGEIDSQAFQAAWQQLLDRHAVLRSSFHWKSLPKPVQVVRSHVVLPFQYLDWMYLDPVEQDNQSLQILADDRVAGFDLSKAPLMRLRLIHLGGGKHRLIWSDHHVLLDGWSRLILFDEFNRLYDGLKRQQPEPLQPVRQFREYIHWLKSQNQCEAKQFWTTALSPVRSGVQLPGSSSAGRVQASSGAQMQGALSKDSTEQLKRLAKDRRLTLNTIAQGAWALLLSHLSDSREVVFGMVVSGRPPDLAQVESIVGPFINTVPVVLRINPDEALLSCLQNLQAQTIQGGRYHYLPLVEIQACSNIPKGTPLFDTILVFQNYPSQQHLRQGLEIDSVTHRVWQDFPLVVSLRPGLELELIFSFDTGRYGKSLIQSLLHQYIYLLDRIAADPHGACSGFERELSQCTAATRASNSRNFSEIRRKKFRETEARLARSNGLV
jgi:hypothetical protein